MKTKLITALLILTGILGSAEKRAQPRFAEDNQLLRPEGYREWIFIGSNLGMGYSQAQADGHDSKPVDFHNLYIQPEAYRKFVETGKFPDKTILVMEKVSAATNASINKRGQFQDRFLGIEAAVKDEKRFPEKWAYFDFIGKGTSPLTQAKAFPRDACWKCHNEHAASDNVFVQFYPVLRQAREQRLAPQ